MTDESHAHATLQANDTDVDLGNQNSSSHLATIFRLYHLGWDDPSDFLSIYSSSNLKNPAHLRIINANNKEIVFRLFVSLNSLGLTFVY